jgi:hypothetical protein
MKYKTRTRIYKEIWDFCKKTWDTKGKDYSGEDVLSNFKVTAEKYGMTPEQVLCILMDKHYIAIQKYIKRGDLKGEPIEDKILDNINYLGLLLCLIKEKKEDSLEDHIETR